MTDNLSVGTHAGIWVVTDEPVRVVVKCSECGARRLQPVDRLTGDRPPPCDACGAGRIRLPRGGESATAIYQAWVSMRHRCTDRAPARVQKHYVDRGISVCAEWRDYDAFRDWSLANGWAEGLQLDRRDNDGDYTPDNCRWITARDNNLNRSTNVTIEAWGERKILIDWLADPRCVVDYHVVYDRLYRTRGKPWTPERALSTPRRKLSNNAVTPRGPLPRS